MKGSMASDEPITSLQLSPKGMKTPVTKVVSGWELSDGPKSNQKHELVTVPLWDGFRAGFSDITSFSVLKVMSSVLSTLVISPGDRREMMVGEGAWKRQRWADGGVLYVTFLLAQQTVRLYGFFHLFSGYTGLVTSAAARLASQRISLSPAVGALWKAHSSWDCYWKLPGRRQKVEPS